MDADGTRLACRDTAELVCVARIPRGTYCHLRNELSPSARNEPGKPVRPAPRPPPVATMCSTSFEIAIDQQWNSGQRLESVRDGGNIEDRASSENKRTHVIPGYHFSNIPVGLIILVCVQSHKLHYQLIIGHAPSTHKTTNGAKFQVTG